MLSLNKQNTGDPLILNLVRRRCLEHVFSRYNLLENELDTLLIVHTLQKTYNCYISLSDIREFYAFSYYSFNKWVKVLVNRGYIERINGYYNVTLEGLTIIRSFETVYARLYSEVSEKKRKEWKHLPALVKRQKENRQYPIKVIDNNKRVKVLGRGLKPVKKKE